MKEPQIEKRRVEKALKNAIVESYLQGVSTRRIKEIVYSLGVEKISPWTVFCTFLFSLFYAFLS
ncbi:hypothetical protein BG95_04100 [Thermosipho sp. 1063]|nr:hypothetical protein BG95_04100 [Thermosipho sp. 1063]